MSTSKRKKNIVAELKNTGLIVAGELPTLLDPDIVSNPAPVIARFIQNVASKRTAQFIEEYKARKKIGELKEENESKTDKPALSLLELLKYLQDEPPEEELFRALKSIFFCGVRVGATAKDEALAYEFLQTARKLSGTEILILKANFEIAKGNFHPEVNQNAIQNGLNHRSTWRRMIAKQMGYGDLHSMVIKYESNLESLGLIAPRNEMDRLQGDYDPTGANFRLTEFGQLFCEFVVNFDN